METVVPLAGISSKPIGVGARTRNTLISLTIANVENAQC